MSKLSKPSLELATKVLSELEYADRLNGYRMSPAVGNARHSLFSFQEATNFLKIGDIGDLMIKGGSTSIAFINPQELRTWVDRVYGDQELVAALDELLATEASLAEKISTMKQLMKERLDGCHAVLAAENDNQKDKEGHYA